MFARMKEDIITIFGNDPAANSWLEEVLINYGLHALWLHRIAH
jgi:serine O-acetyltransferase